MGEGINSEANRGDTARKGAAKAGRKNNNAALKCALKGELKKGV